MKRASIVTVVVASLMAGGFFAYKKNLLRTPSRFQRFVASKKSGAPLPAPSLDPTTTTSDPLQEGLVALPVECSSDTCKLSVTLSQPKSCFMADSDLVVGDLAQSSRKIVLLSLEPIVKTLGFEPSVKKLHHTEFTAGLKQHFIFRRPAGRVDFGLYVCKASDEEMGCAKKPAADYTEGFRELGLAVQKDPSYRPPDRTYYFQPIHYDGERWLTYASQPGSKELTKGATFLLSRVGEKEKEALRAILITSNQLTGKLGSLPLEIKDGGVEIRMPKFAQDCQK